MSGRGVALVVEDDDDVRGLLEDVLRTSGFDVRTAATGREGAELARTEKPAVVTLDVGLPDIDGFEVLRRIRTSSDAYVVMLSARCEELDTLFALQSGADDYLTKPFRPRELRARIGAMMRRPRMQDAGASPSATVPPARTAADPVLQNRELTVDPRTRTAAINSTQLELTRSEFDLLEALLRAHGRVLTRSELVRVARGDRSRDDTYVSETDERAVEVHLGNLRRKLGDDPKAPHWLVTVRGVGYRIV